MEKSHHLVTKLVILTEVDMSVSLFMFETVNI